MADNNEKNEVPPSKIERLIGIVFAFLVLALVAYTVVMEIKIDDNKMPLLYILIAIMAGAVVATIPGFLNMDYSGKGVSIRAAGGVAAFVLVLSALQEMTVPSINTDGPVIGTNSNKTNNTTQFQQQAQQVQTIQQSFRATSYCSMTGASGYGVSTNLQQAQTIAIQYCVASGGIFDCCAGNVRTEQLY